MRLCFKYDIFLHTLGILQGLSTAVSTVNIQGKSYPLIKFPLIHLPQAAATTTVGSVISNHDGNAFGAVFEIELDGSAQIYYYASNMTPVTPFFQSTSVQLTYDNVSELVGTQYIAEGSVGEGSLSFVLDNGPVISATISQQFDSVQLYKV